MIYTILFGTDKSQYSMIKFEDYETYMECKNNTPNELDLALVSTKFRPTGVNCNRGYISYTTDYTVLALDEYTDILESDFDTIDTSDDKYVYIVVWEHYSKELGGGFGKNVQHYDNLDKAKEHVKLLKSIDTIGYVSLYKSQRMDIND